MFAFRVGGKPRAASRRSVTTPGYAPNPQRDNSREQAKHDKFI